MMSQSLEAVFRNRFCGFSVGANAMALARRYNKNELEATALPSFSLERA